MRNKFKLLLNRLYDKGFNSIKEFFFDKKVLVFIVSVVWKIIYVIENISFLPLKFLFRLFGLFIKSIRLFKDRVIKQLKIKDIFFFFVRIIYTFFFGIFSVIINIFLTIYQFIFFYIVKKITYINLRFKYLKVIVIKLNSIFLNEKKVEFNRFFFFKRFLVWVSRFFDKEFIKIFREKRFTFYKNYFFILQSFSYIFEWLSLNLKIFFRKILQNIIFFIKLVFTKSVNGVIFIFKEIRRLYYLCSYFILKYKYDFDEKRAKFLRNIKRNYPFIYGYIIYGSTGYYVFVVYVFLFVYYPLVDIAVEDMLTNYYNNLYENSSWLSNLFQFSENFNRVFVDDFLNTSETPLLNKKRNTYLFTIGDHADAFLIRVLLIIFYFLGFTTSFRDFWFHENNWDVSFYELEEDEDDMFDEEMEETEDEPVEDHIGEQDSFEVYEYYEEFRDKGFIKFTTPKNYSFSGSKEVMSDKGWKGFVLCWIFIFYFEIKMSSWPSAYWIIFPYINTANIKASLWPFVEISFWSNLQTYSSWMPGSPVNSAWSPDTWYSLWKKEFFVKYPRDWMEHRMWNRQKRHGVHMSEGLQLRMDEYFSTYKKGTRGTLNYDDFQFLNWMNDPREKSFGQYDKKKRFAMTNMQMSGRTLEFFNKTDVYSKIYRTWPFVYRDINLWRRSVIGSRSLLNPLYNKGWNYTSFWPKRGGDLLTKSSLLHGDFKVSDKRFEFNKNTFDYVSKHHQNLIAPNLLRIYFSLLPGHDQISEFPTTDKLVFQRGHHAIRRSVDYQDNTLGREMYDSKAAYDHDIMSDLAGDDHREKTIERFIPVFDYGLSLYHYDIKNPWWVFLDKKMVERLDLRKLKYFSEFLNEMFWKLPHTYERFIALKLWYSFYEETPAGVFDLMKEHQNFSSWEVYWDMLDLTEKNSTFGHWVPTIRKLTRHVARHPERKLRHLTLSDWRIPYPDFVKKRGNILKYQEMLIKMMKREVFSLMHRYFDTYWRFDFASFNEWLLRREKGPIEWRFMTNKHYVAAYVKNHYNELYMTHRERFTWKSAVMPSEHRGRKRSLMYYNRYAKIVLDQIFAEWLVERREGLGPAKDEVLVSKKTRRLQDEWSFSHKYGYIRHKKIGYRFGNYPESYIDSRRSRRGRRGIDTEGYGINLCIKKEKLLQFYKKLNRTFREDVSMQQIDIHLIKFGVYKNVARILSRDRYNIVPPVKNTMNILLTKGGRFKRLKKGYLIYHLKRGENLNFPFFLYRNKDRTLEINKNKYDLPFQSLLHFQNYPIQKRFFRGIEYAIDFFHLRWGYPGLRFKFLYDSLAVLLYRLGIVNLESYSFYVFGFNGQNIEEGFWLYSPYNRASSHFPRKRTRKKKFLSLVELDNYWWLPTQRRFIFFDHDSYYNSYFKEDFEENFNDSVVPYAYKSLSNKDNLEIQKYFLQNRKVVSLLKERTIKMNRYFILHKVFRKYKSYWMKFRLFPVSRQLSYDIISNIASIKKENGDKLNTYAYRAGNLPIDLYYYYYRDPRLQVVWGGDVYEYNQMVRDQLDVSFLAMQTNRYKTYPYIIRHMHGWIYRGMTNYEYYYWDHDLQMWYVMTYDLNLIKNFIAKWKKI